MSNCTISAKDSKTLATQKLSCRQTACNHCRRDMVCTPEHSANDLPDPSAMQLDIIHDFVQRLESSIAKHSEN